MMEEVGPEVDLDCIYPVYNDKVKGYGFFYVDCFITPAHLLDNGPLNLDLSESTHYVLNKEDADFYQFNLYRKGSDRINPSGLDLAIFRLPDFPLVTVQSYVREPEVMKVCTSRDDCRNDLYKCELRDINDTKFLECEAKLLETYGNSKACRVAPSLSENDYGMPLYADDTIEGMLVDIRHNDDIFESDCEEIDENICVFLRFSRILAAIDSLPPRQYNVKTFDDEINSYFLNWDWFRDFAYESVDLSSFVSGKELRIEGEFLIYDPTLCKQPIKRFDDYPFGIVRCADAASHNIGLWNIVREALADYAKTGGSKSWNLQGLCIRHQDWSQEWEEDCYDASDKFRFGALLGNSKCWYNNALINIEMCCENPNGVQFKEDLLEANSKPDAKAITLFLEAYLRFNGDSMYENWFETDFQKTHELLTRFFAIPEENMDNFECRCIEKSEKMRDMIESVKNVADMFGSDINDIKWVDEESEDAPF